MDPILNPADNFTVFPIRYQDLWDLYKKAEASFWVVEEINFSDDAKDWVKLDDNQKHFIKMVLAFFAVSDGIVYKNIHMNFINTVQISEAQSFYAYQGFNERIHGETYSLMIEMFSDSREEKMHLFDSINNYPCVHKKAKWAERWIDSEDDFATKLVAFMCVEGIFFSGSFCAIYWLKQFNLMHGLTYSNELISRDEGLHLEFAVALYSHLQKKVNPEIVLAIVKSAIEIEKEFITEAIPVRMIKMDSDKMISYIQFCGDRLLKMLNLKPYWNVENPFDWMEQISVNGKTNFFEKKVSEYNHAEDVIVSFAEDF